MNAVLRWPLGVVMFLFLGVSASRAFTFTLSAGADILVPIESLTYVGTFSLPGHGSTSALYLDVDPATLEAGERLAVSLYRGSTVPPGPFEPAFMSVDARIDQQHEVVDGIWRFTQGNWGEPLANGWLRISMTGGSADLKGLKFENVLSDFTYPRGANPGALDDYNIYSFALTQVPEPGSLALGAVAAASVLGWYLGRRRVFR